jgi:hypothetical protein
VLAEYRILDLKRFNFEKDSTRPCHNPYSPGLKKKTVPRYFAIFGRPAYPRAGRADPSIPIPVIDIQCLDNQRWISQAKSLRGARLKCMRCS